MANGCVSAQQEAYMLKMLEDGDVLVRLAAVEALYDSGEKRKSLQVLNEVLQYGDERMRTAALNTLQRFGFNVTPARKLFSNESEVV